MTNRSRGVPVRRTTRTTVAARSQVPLHRAGPIGGQPQGTVPDNDTGLPKTPADVPTPDAHDDTGTLPWNEEWDDTSKPKKTPEDGDGKSLHENADGKPELMPGLDDSTKATHIEESGGVIAPLGQPAPVPTPDEHEDSQNAWGGVADAFEAASSKGQVHRLDDPPSPADVPEDMRYDPEGEGTPGLMPPVAAPVPGTDDQTQRDVTGGSGGNDGMDYLVPAGSGEGNSEFGDDNYLGQDPKS